MQRKNPGSTKKPTLKRTAMVMMGRTGFPKHRLRLSCRETIRDDSEGTYYRKEGFGGDSISLRAKKFDRESLFILAHELAHYKFHNGRTSKPDYLIEYEADSFALTAMWRLHLYSPSLLLEAKRHIRNQCKIRARYADADYHRGWNWSVIKWCGFRFSTNNKFVPRMVYSPGIPDFANDHGAWLTHGVAMLNLIALVDEGSIFVFKER